MRSLFHSIALRTAIILVIITIVWTLIEHFLGFNTTRHDIGQYTRMVTPFLFYIGIGIAVVTKRRHEHNTLGFAEGFRTGLGVTAIYSVLSTLWLALYAEVINPQYKPTLLAFEKEKLIAEGTSPADMDTKLIQAEAMTGGSITSYVYLLIFTIIAGVIVSLLAALILRKVGPRQLAAKDAI